MMAGPGASSSSALNPDDARSGSTFLRLSLVTTLHAISLFSDRECPQTSKVRSQFRSTL